MTPEAAISMLDRQIDAHGEDVTIYRASPASNTGAVRAKVMGLRSEQLRPSSSGAQGVFRAILSPTGLAGFMPKVTDKVRRGSGEQRAITYVNPIMLGGTLVRVEVDFQG